MAVYTNEIGKDSLIKYLVNSDDTLPKIALKFNITMGELSTLNHLSNQLIYPGMELYVPSCNLPEKPNVDENQLKIGMPSSPLFPGLFKPLLLHTPLELNTSYGLKISRGCIRLGASLFSLIDKHNKKSVELTLNPTTISINILPSSAPFYKDKINKRIYNYCCLGYRYSISLKSIRSFTFFNTMDDLISGDISSQRFQPVHCNDAVVKCESLDKIHRRSRSNLCHKFSQTTRASCTSDVTGLENNLRACALDKTKNVAEPTAVLNKDILHSSTSNIALNNLGEESASLKDQTSSPRSNIHIFTDNSSTKTKHKHLKKEKSSNSTAASPISRSKHAYRSFVKFFTLDKSANDTIVDKHKKAPLKLPKITINDDCEESSYIYVSMTIKEGISKDSITIFRDYDHLYNSENPQLLFEISQNHVELFREFALENLPKNNIKFNDVVPINVLSESSESSDIASILSHEIFESVCNRSRILDISFMHQMSDYFPTSAMMQPITLGYSTFVHGTSMRTLYQNMLKFKDSPSVLIILDELESMFGAILSCLPKISINFYGNGECVLFKKVHGEEPRFFPWSQKNNYFMKGDRNYFAIGIGEHGHGLWINEDLISGYSSPCETFDNELLSTTRNFKCKLIEIWVFG